MENGDEDGEVSRKLMTSYVRYGTRWGSECKSPRYCNITAWESRGVASLV